MELTLFPMGYQILRKLPIFKTTFGRLKILGLLGYSDDNICLAPSLKALQDMLRTCQEFAAEHNLKFSTDVNPSKCKTKTLAFLKDPRPLPNLHLCGNPLPWTDKCQHLGTLITTKIDGCEEDIKNKNARYIARNVELNQEFSFAHPLTKLKINSIYNYHLQVVPFGTCLVQEPKKFRAASTSL